MHPASKRVIDRAPGPLKRPVRIVVRTIDSSINDRLPGLAAEIAFWVLLSLPALLLAMIAAAGVVGNAVGEADWQDAFLARAIEVARVALTEGTIDSIVRPTLERLLEPDGGVAVISTSFAAAVWIASRAVRVVLTTLTIVAGREHMRKGWLDRLLGFGITFGALVVGIVLLPLLLVGPNLGDQIAGIADADLGLFADTWRTLYWPVVVVLGTLVIAVLYRLGVPGRTNWRHELPGAVLATGVWLAGSGGLRLYGMWVLDGDTVYGSLAGPIVLLLWLWLTGFAVLLGAELNGQFMDPEPEPAAGTGPETAATATASADPTPKPAAKPASDTTPATGPGSVRDPGSDPNHHPETAPQAPEPQGPSNA